MLIAEAAATLRFAAAAADIAAAIVATLMLISTMPCHFFSPLRRTMPLTYAFDMPLIIRDELCHAMPDAMPFSLLIFFAFAIRYARLMLIRLPLMMPSPDAAFRLRQLLRQPARYAITLQFTPYVTLRY